MPAAAPGSQALVLACESSPCSPARCIMPAPGACPLLPTPTTPATPPLARTDPHPGNLLAVTTPGKVKVALLDFGQVRAEEGGAASATAAARSGCRLPGQGTRSTCASLQRPPAGGVCCAAQMKVLSSNERVRYALLCVAMASRDGDLLRWASVAARAFYSHATLPWAPPAPPAAASASMWPYQVLACRAAGPR